MKISEYLKKHNMTHREFGLLVDVTEGMVSHYVNERHLPRLSTALRIEKRTNGEVTRADQLPDLFKGFVQLPPGRTEVDSSRPQANRRPRGEGHGRAKLNAGQVVEILSTRGETRKSVARRFNVSERLIGMIWNRKVWTHLPMPAEPTPGG